MNENIKLLIQKVSADEELIAKFREVSNPDEAYALASSVQDGFTKEEFIDAMTKIKESLEGDELSDADLAAIAGGSTASWIISTAAGGGAVISTIVSAAMTFSL